MSQLQNDEGDKVTQVPRETEGGFEPCNESPRRGSWGRTGRLVKPKWKETNVLRCFSPGRKSLVMEPPRPPKKHTHTHVRGPQRWGQRAALLGRCIRAELL